MKFVVYAAGVRPEVVTHLLAAGDDVVAAHDMAQLAASMANADALILQDFTYSPEVARLCGAAPDLKWIQLLTSGYDKLQSLGAPAHVMITNARGAFTASVAVHAVSAYLALLRGVPQALRQQTQAQWQRDYAAQLVIPAGMNVLIAGFGSIGQEIARLLRPFGPRIIGVSASGRVHELADEMYRAKDFQSLLPKADAIFLCLPLSGATRHMIGATELAACKRNAVLINVGRGGLTDQIALAQALHDGLILGAASDVTEPEPLPADHPLWRAPNLILSPHVSGAAGETGYRNQAQPALDNIARYRRGEALENRVTLEQAPS